MCTNCDLEKVSTDCFLFSITTNLLIFPYKHLPFPSCEPECCSNTLGQQVSQVNCAICKQNYNVSSNLLISFFFVSSSSLLFSFPAEQYSHTMLLYFEVYVFVVLLILL